MLAALFILLSTQLGTAQPAAVEKAMSLGVYPGIELNLPTDARQAERFWRDFIKDYDGKTKKVRGEGEWLAAGMELIAVGGSDPVNVYALVEKAGSNESEITVWFQLKDGSFVGPDNEPAAFDGAMQLMSQFERYVQKRLTEMELEEQERKLKDLERELTRLQRDKENYEDAIRKAEETIRKMKANIADNEKAQEDTRLRIEMQKKAVEEIRRRLSSFDQ